MRLRTPVCELLGIEYPIFAAGMGGVTGAALAAAVSGAGGMGVLGATFMTADELGQEITAVRDATDRPFAVNVLIPGDIPAKDKRGKTPPFPEFLEDLLPGVAGLPHRSPPPLTLELARAQVDVALKARVAVIAAGLGTPDWLVDQVHGAGARVMSLVGSVHQARHTAERGADVIIAQGAEAGGHVGQIGTFVLVPAVAESVQVPVLAAGGIADGHGLAAALMLGADGVWVGTRFVASAEAAAHTNHKQQIVEASEQGTVVSRAYTGKPSRVLRNLFTERWEGHEAGTLPMPWQRDWMEPLVAPAKQAGHTDIGNFPTGQVAGRITSVLSAAEIVRQMVDEAQKLLAR